MIIGISGKINSGKDLVGEMILDLTSKQECWQIKKFADPLKDIVCILLNCTRKQLEDREFKEKELGNKWEYWNITTHWINDDYQYQTVDYIYETKKEAEEYFKIIGGNKCADEPVLVKLTPRKLLQLLGTQCGRNIIHPNIWINSLMSQYKNTITSFDLAKLPEGETIDSFGIENCKNLGTIIQKESNWIITDVRFPNEANAIKEKDGLMLRIERGQYDPECRICGVKASKHNAHHPYIKKIEHESETALDNYEFDYIIENNGTIEDLKEKVKNILIEKGAL